MTKQTQWQSIAVLVGSLTDTRGQPVDPGIKEVVTVLLALGFPTDGSCGGHLDHGIASPWVDIGRNLPEQYVTLFAKVGVPHKPNKPPHVVDVFATYPELHRLRQTNLRWQGLLKSLLRTFYHPHHGSRDTQLVLKAIGCYGVVRLISHGARHQAERTPQQREVRLRLYQREMQAFGAFLKAHYFATAESDSAGADRYATGRSR